MKGIPFFKPNVQTLPSYSVPVEFAGVKLNQNESPLDIAPEIKEEIFQRLRHRSWNRYPSPNATPLTEQIAAYTGFPVDGILVGNGSNELIQTIILSCCDTGDTLLTVSPTFPVYRRVAEVMGIHTIEVPLRYDFSFDTPRMIEIITQTPEIKLIILACPNNPTGTVLERAEIQQIAAHTMALLVVDEAYFEFYGQSTQELLHTNDNMVVLRTFSKSLRAAGVRLGYLLAAPALIAVFSKIKLPFSMGLFQQVAGEVILEHRLWLQADIASTLQERERVFFELCKLPDLQPIPSQANFILFRCRSGEAMPLFKVLQQKGVLVRSYESGTLAGMLRVSIGTVAENNLFLVVLVDCLAEKLCGGNQ